MQLESLFEQSARRRPEKTALVCGKQRLSYAEIEQRANRLAHTLIRNGVQRGDRVAILLDNSPEAVISILAVLKAGAVFVMVNPTTKSEKLAFLLNDCRAAAIVLPAARLAALDACWRATPYLKTRISTGESGSAEPVLGNRPMSWKEACEDPALPVRPPDKRCIDIDLAALVYTSGSTGQPKGVMLTHLNMVKASTSITSYLANEPEDIILNVLPLAFDYGLYQVLMSFQFGGTVILERSFAYPHAVLQRLVEERATGFPIVPTMLAMLLQIDLRKYDLSSLRYVTNTGAALPTAHIRRLRELVPHVTLFSMYGLTECKRVSYLPPDQVDIRPDSVGKAIPNSEVYLVDDDGRRLGPGAVGELVVRGANVMKGYWERPDETAHVLRPGPLPGEQVLHSGDLFRTDEEGYLYFVGRKDDILKSRGEKVSPREVENTLCRHPGIAEAAVIGVPDRVLGQAIQAIVTLRNGCELSERDVLRHCAQFLEDFMIPQSVVFRSELPRNANGKVDKRTLQQQFLGVTS